MGSISGLACPGTCALRGSPGCLPDCWFLPLRSGEVMAASTTRSPGWIWGLRGLVAIALILAGVGLWQRLGDVSLDDVRAPLLDLGPLGPVVFALVYGIAATLLLPGAPFTIAAGLIFGPVVGALTALVGATLGATGAFSWSRFLGQEVVERLARGRLDRVNSRLERRGFLTVLVLRLIPLAPFNAVNLGCGLARVQTRHYIPATALGIIPGTLVYASLGGTIADPLSPAFLGAVAALVALIVITTLIARRDARRRAALVPEPGE